MIGIDLAITIRRRSVSIEVDLAEQNQIERPYREPYSRVRLLHAGQAAAPFAVQCPFIGAVNLAISKTPVSWACSVESTTTGRNHAIIVR